MTAVDTVIAAKPVQARSSVGGLRKALSFGTGLGVVVRARDLDVMLVKVRPGGIRILDTALIEDYAQKPADEWGAQLRAMLKRHDAKGLGATVLLPRGDVSVRQVSMPGVAGKDMSAAVALQMDTLHPYGDEEALSAWQRAPGRNGAVLVGVARQEAIYRFSALFAEAGLPVASFTFPAAAIHAALRLTGAPPAHLLAYTPNEFGHELYGESTARPVFSAEMDVAPARAFALAAAELRLSSEEARPLIELLPKPQGEVASVLAYATALAGACPWLSSAVNLLPPERRTVRGRSWLIPTIVLGTLLLLAGVGLLLLHPWTEQQYLDSLHGEMSRVEPVATKAALFDRKTAEARADAQSLDAFHHQTQADLDTLNELTRLLASPAWTVSTEIYPDSVVIAGEAPQAEPLLKLLNSSPLFQGAEFVTSVSKVPGGAEQFRIKALRRVQP
jgi:hypothetical protein